MTEGGWGKGEMRSGCLMGMGFLFGVIINVLKLTVAMVSQLCEYTRSH